MKICFVALNCYNLVSRQESMRHIGGAEVQQWLMANWLRSRGVGVDFITLDHGQPDGIVHDSIRVYKAFDRDAGLPVVRFISPRWTGLWAAMKRSNSDIYYQRGAGAETGQVAGWCRMRRKKFVHAVAHEPDCCRELSKLHNLRERVLYRWGLKLADEVIVQTATQQRLLQEQFGRTSCVVQNCAVPISMSSNNDSREPVSEGGSVLWIGRLHPVKRFEWLLELAKRMHQTEFVVIGGANVETEYDRQLVGRVKDLSNVRFLGEIPYEKMGAHYREARVLCCTSVKEGFPNVFLEAWRTGVPVVSTVDPDGVVERNGLGVIANTLDELESALRQLVSTGHRYDDMSRRCRSYFLENHTPEKTLAAFERVLHTL